MQNNREMNSNEEHEHWKDILSKQWKKDYPSMTQDEILLTIQNMFWQMFMIQIEAVKVVSNVNEDGQFLTFTLTGEAFRDVDGLPNHMLPKMEEEDDEEI